MARNEFSVIPQAGTSSYSRLMLSECSYFEEAYIKFTFAIKEHFVLQSTAGTYEIWWLN